MAAIKRSSCIWDFCCVELSNAARSCMFSWMAEMGHLRASEVLDKQCSFWPDLSVALAPASWPL